MRSSSHAASTIPVGQSLSQAQVPEDTWRAPVQWMLCLAGSGWWLDLPFLKKLPKFFFVFFVEWGSSGSSSAVGGWTGGCYCLCTFWCRGTHHVHQLCCSSHHRARELSRSIVCIWPPSAPCWTSWTQNVTKSQTYPLFSVKVLLLGLPA